MNDLDRTSDATDELSDASLAAASGGQRFKTMRGGEGWAQAAAHANHGGGGGGGTPFRDLFKDPSWIMKHLPAKNPLCGNGCVNA